MIRRSERDGVASLRAVRRESVVATFDPPPAEPLHLRGVEHPCGVRPRLKPKPRDIIPTDPPHPTALQNRNGSPIAVLNPSNKVVRRDTRPASRKPRKKIIPRFPKRQNRAQSVAEGGQVEYFLNKKYSLAKVVCPTQLATRGPNKSPEYSISA